MKYWPVALRSDLFRTRSSPTGGRLQRGRDLMPSQKYLGIHPSFLQARYCMTYFLFDLLSWFPIDLLVQVGPTQVVPVLFENVTERLND